LIEKEKRRKGKKRGNKKKKMVIMGKVSLGLDPPCWLCSRSQLLGAIKGSFVGQSLNFFLNLV
jgi:hypothetical protein